MCKQEDWWFPSLFPQCVGLGAETQELLCWGQWNTQHSVYLLQRWLMRLKWHRKTVSASEGEFTGFSFFNDFNKSSSHKPPGLNWNTPGFEQGRGIVRGMQGVKGESVRGVRNEVNSLRIGWVQIVMNEWTLFSSVCLAEKCHKVPGEIVIYLPNNVKGTREHTIAKISLCLKHSCLFELGDSIINFACLM